MFNRELLLHAVFLMILQHANHSYTPLVKSKWVKPAKFGNGRCVVYSGIPDKPNNAEKEIPDMVINYSKEISDMAPVTSKKRQSRSPKVEPAEKYKVNRKRKENVRKYVKKQQNVDTLQDTPRELRASTVHISMEEVSHDGTADANVQSYPISHMSHGSNEEWQRRSCTLDPVEEKIIQILKDIIGKESSKPIYRLGEGLYLMSYKGLRTVDAFIKPHNCLINDVPFNYREGNHAQLLKCIERDETNGRVSLLCTGAFQGSGKTVQQAINLKEFVVKTNGIGIEVTYNDDQTGIKGETPENAIEFFEGIALRVFHRILCLHFDSDNASGHIIKNETLLNMTKLLTVPLRSALRITREMLGAPADTKIMLGVDELSKVEGDRITHTRMLKALCAAMDADDSLYLTVAAYGCFDIADFVTVSNRALLFQPLGPLMLEVSEEMGTHLPPILQPFFNEKLRRLLPFTREALEQYARLSKLLLMTGGHARRISKLYTALRSYPGSLNGKEFVASLKEFLDKNEDIISLKMNDVAKFPKNFNALFSKTKKSRAVQMESLATDTACSFEFGEDSEFRKLHRIFLLGTVDGYCQYVSDGRPLDVSKSGFAFIPLPVLLTIETGKSSKWKPCTMALQQLGEALYEYGTVPNRNETGKAFERVVLNSLLLFARSKDKFRLCDLCRSSRCGAGFDARLEGGPGVQLWTDIKVFPRYKPADKSPLMPKIQNLVTRLHRSGANGALFQPTDTHNMGGDVYGLFKDVNNGYVLLVVQVKDWFLDKVYTNGIPKTLQECLYDTYKEFPEREFMNITVEGENVRVERRVVLFCSNEPQTALQLEAHSAVITIKDMRRWLPTAAYSCELAHKLRFVFTHIREGLSSGVGDE